MSFSGPKTEEHLFLLFSGYASDHSQKKALASNNERYDEYLLYSDMMELATDAVKGQCMCVQ